MDQVRLSCGRRTDNPYFIDKLAVRIYSVEELCFCIMLDAYLLDESFACAPLCSWIEEECELPALADRLEAHLKSRGSVDGFARIILEYVGFYSGDAVDETCAIIRDNAHLSIYEKNKSRADYLLMCGRLSLALAAYSDLLETIPENEKKVSAQVWHNCGYAYARMFRFSEAARAYYCSYKCLPDDETLLQFILSLRMSMDKTKYLEYISEHPEFYEVSQKAERSLARESGAYEGTDEHRMIMALKVLREENSPGAYSGSTYTERLEEILEELKTGYREMVSI